MPASVGTTVSNGSNRREGSQPGARGPGVSDHSQTKAAKGPVMSGPKSKSEPPLGSHQCVRVSDNAFRTRVPLVDYHICFGKSVSHSSSNATLMHERCEIADPSARDFLPMDRPTELVHNLFRCFIRGLCPEGVDTFTPFRCQHPGIVPHHFHQTLAVALVWTEGTAGNRHEAPR